MAYDFDSNWAQQIADISSDPAYQNATIKLQNGATVLLTDTRARIIGVRPALDASGAQTGDATAAKKLRVQFPYEAYPDRVPHGTLVRVVDGGRNPALEGYLIVVESDNFSSNRASHTLECTVDVESVASWS